MGTWWGNECVQHDSATVIVYTCLNKLDALMWTIRLWASCQIRKIACSHAPGMPGTFSLSPQVSVPDMHHGTLTSGFTSGFLWNRRRGKTFPAFPTHAQPAILRIWQEAHAKVLERRVRAKSRDYTEWLYKHLSIQLPLPLHYWYTTTLYYMAYPHGSVSTNMDVTWQRKNTGAPFINMD